MAAATAVRRQVRELTLAACRLLPRADEGLVADRGAVATIAVLRAGLALRLTADEATPAAAGVLQAVSGRGTTLVRARARLLQARTGRRGLAAFARLVGVFAGALLAPLGILAGAVLAPARVLGGLPRLDHLRPLD